MCVCVCVCVYVCVCLFVFMYGNEEAASPQPVNLLPCNKTDKKE